MLFNSKTIGLLLALQALVLLPRHAHARRSKCPESRDLEMDRCASQMGFVGDHTFRVPKNASSMESFCLQMKESLGCVQNYSRDCLTGFTKQILAGLLKRGKQQYQSICQQPIARNEFRSKMACLTDDKIDTFHKCVDGSIARFEFISTQVKPEDRLPNLCCSYQIFFADTDQTLSRLCGQQAEANRFVQKLVVGTTGELVQLICEGHRSLADCRRSDKTKDNMQQLEELTKAAKAGKLRPHSKSLIPPLLEILDTSN